MILSEAEKLLLKRAVYCFLWDLRDLSLMNPWIINYQCHCLCPLFLFSLSAHCLLHQLFLCVFPDSLNQFYLLKTAPHPTLTSIFLLSNQGKTILHIRHSYYITSLTTVS